MHKLLTNLFLIVVISFHFVSCKEDIDPAKQTELNRNKIIHEAPIKNEYEIEKPKDNLPENIKAFSGHWIGKWNDVIPSQLVVVSINHAEASFIYSWGANQHKGIESGIITETAKIDERGRIKYVKDDLSLTFTVDTLLNKVIGVSIRGDVVSNIVMEKVK